jgi:hypothetical protein
MDVHNIPKGCLSSTAHRLLAIGYALWAQANVPNSANLVASYGRVKQPMALALTRPGAGAGALGFGLLNVNC